MITHLEKPSTDQATLPSVAVGRQTGKVGSPLPARVAQLRALQDKAGTSPRVAQLLALQETANTSAGRSPAAQFASRTARAVEPRRPTSMAPTVQRYLFADTPEDFSKLEDLGMW